MKALPRVHGPCYRQTGAVYYWAQVYREDGSKRAKEATTKKAVLEWLINELGPAEYAARRNTGPRVADAHCGQIVATYNGCRCEEYTECEYNLDCLDLTQRQLRWVGWRKKVEDV